MAADTTRYLQLSTAVKSLVFVPAASSPGPTRNNVNLDRPLQYLCPGISQEGLIDHQTQQTPESVPGSVYLGINIECRIQL